MTETSATPPQSPVPPDDPRRHLTVARPEEDQSLHHLGVVGDTYTILVTGEDTAGKYTLIDMHVPPGGGPPPHRHDFEEMFTILDGEVELSFREQTFVAKAGRLSTCRPRLLCVCAPAGQEKFFTAIGAPVTTRTEPPPELDEDASAAFMAKSKALAPEYRTELLLP